MTDGGYRALRGLLTGTELAVHPRRRIMRKRVQDRRLKELRGRTALNRMPMSTYIRKNELTWQWGC